jgi:hypothetical protein
MRFRTKCPALAKRGLERGTRSVSDETGGECLSEHSMKGPRIPPLRSVRDAKSEEENRVGQLLGPKGSAKQLSAECQ